ncbi:triose-phosphate isomerase [Mollicutes bacterium LVI A0039]|nr:triose-phosphate isomerase [Mollicutes bacterium LVI A0039]
MRNTIIAGNWKMNKTLDEALAFVEELKSIDTSSYTGQKMIFAPSVYLAAMVEATKGTDIVVGCQNMHEKESGAYTGEVSADMLLSIGVTTTLIGHSERREYYNETDGVVNAKMKLAIAKNIRPILCIGEILTERENDLTNSVLERQVKKAFEGLSEAEVKDVVIAYEPVWAIGTGLTATSKQANEACNFVRSIVKSLYSDEIANNMVIQYGGSVKPDNIVELLSKSDIDGALVGGASLDVASYVALLK